jgi:hypothetical protein
MRKDCWVGVEGRGFSLGIEDLNFVKGGREGGEVIGLLLLWQVFG